jgi:hypothetical protein
MITAYEQAGVERAQASGTPGIDSPQRRNRPIVTARHEYAAQRSAGPA